MFWGTQDIIVFAKLVICSMMVKNMLWNIIWLINWVIHELMNVGILIISDQFDTQWTPQAEWTSGQGW